MQVLAKVIVGNVGRIFLRHPEPVNLEAPRKTVSRGWHAFISCSPSFSGFPFRLRGLKCQPLEFDID
jgi:hypothetical protein